MKSQHERAYRCVKIAVLGLAVALTGLAGTSLAQGNPAQITVQPPSSDQIIKEGGPDFEVNVVASDVQNLAAFQFGLQYNRSVLKFVGVKEGTLLGSSGRQVNCPDPRLTQDGNTETLQFNCVTLGPPVSLGGTKGADGSGLLATVTFSPVGGGNTPLNLRASDSILVAAEIDASGMPVEISSSSQNASLDVVGTGGGFRWLIVGLVVVVAIVVIGAVGGGFVLMRRRSRGTPLTP
ncbi:MAG: cohesin domain-containing protein [Dehalococcoidia bacterium]|jgi:hypothetical protein